MPWESVQTQGWINGCNATSGTSSHVLTQAVLDKFESYWKQIAGEFEDMGEHLIFETLNEEGVFSVNGDSAQGLDYAPLNRLNQLFVDTVRAQGGQNASRGLLIAGFGTDIAKTCVPSFAIPSDPAGAGRILLSVHYYSPAPFCILNEPANWGGIVYPASTWGTAAEKAELASDFTLLANFCAARGVKAIIGKFGCAMGRQDYPKAAGARTLWMYSVASAALGYGMVPVLWDVGGDISHSTGAFYSDFAAVMDQLGL